MTSLPFRRNCIRKFRFAFLATLLLVPQAVTAQTGPLAQIDITGPASGTFTNSERLHVEMSFVGRVQNSSLQHVELLINGVVVQTVNNPVPSGPGSYALDVNLSNRTDETLHLVARAYQAGVDPRRPRGALTLVAMSPVVQVTIDRTPPTVTVMTPIDGSLNLNELRPSLRVEFFDNLAGVSPTASSLTLDGINVGAGIAITDDTLTFEPAVDLPEAEHTYSVRIVDRAGNVTTSAVSFTTVVADAAAIIGPQGGTLRLEEGPFAGAELQIPPGALTRDTVISMRAAPDPLNQSGSDQVLELRPHGTTFVVPIRTRLPSSQPDDGTIIYLADLNSQWTALPSETCSATDLCIELRSFSHIATKHSQICRWAQELVEPKWATCTELQDDVATSPTAALYQPVLLVHGFDHSDEKDEAWGFGGDNYWGSMGALLSNEQFDVWQFRYNSWQSIDKSASALKLAITKIKAATGAAGVSLVAHSEGGLVSRRYLEKAGPSASDTVFRLITIGTPHKGALTPFVDFIPLRIVSILRNILVIDPFDFFELVSPSAFQMLPDSWFLKKLDEDSATPTTLLGSQPQYVFLAGRKHVRDGHNCFPQQHDGLISIDSARADGLSYGNAYRPDAFDHYPHADKNILMDADQDAYKHICGDQSFVELAQTSPTLQHRIYLEVLRHARISRDLVGWWRFDESQADSTADISGNGYTGTLQGATWVNGGVTLNGGNNTVHFPSAPFELASGTWSVTVKRSAASQGGWIVVKDDIGYRDDGILGLMPDGRVYFDIHAAPSIVHRAISSEPIPVDTPVEITAQWGPGGMDVYVDGRRVAEWPYEGPVLSRGRPLTLGNGIRGAILSFDGEILDLKVYQGRRMP
jgi:hypothetical protein